MRQVALADLMQAARAAQLLPAQARPGFCARLIWRAHVADKHVKRLRKLHPDWGDGSLRSAARACPRAEMSPRTAVQFHAALAAVLEALARHRRANSG